MANSLCCSTSRQLNIQKNSKIVKYQTAFEYHISHVNATKSYLTIGKIEFSVDLEISGKTT